MTRTVVLGLIATSLFLPKVASAQHIERQSLSSTGGQGDKKSPAGHRLGVSAHARYLAFSSQATNLVAGDLNGFGDVFVRDRVTGVTTLVSRSAAGAASDGTTDTPCISRDGRFVGFYSFATTISGPDVNQKADYFVVDRDPDQNGVFDEGNSTVSRINRRPDGIQSVSPPPAWTFSQMDMSADGRFVAFISGDADLLTVADTNGQDDFFVVDRDPDGNGAFENASFKTWRASESATGAGGNGPSITGGISADGAWVTYESQSTNLVAGDDNWVSDVFVKQVGGAAITLISRATDGGAANGPSLSPDISGDGRFVVFASTATDLVPNDTNGVQDVFLHDRDPDGNGVLDEGNGVTSRLSEIGGFAGNGHSHSPTISDDGLRVTFHSDASNFMEQDTNGRSDVFLVDRDPNGDGLPGPGVAIHCLTVAPNGDAADDGSAMASLSPDGAFVVFESRAGNLVDQDTNQVSDIFLAGPGLSLQAYPEVGHGGQPLTLTAFAGEGQAPMAIFTSSVGGAPLLYPVAYGALDAAGAAAVGDNVPPALVGLDVGFVGASVGWHGGLVLSNEVVVSFE